MEDREHIIRRPSGLYNESSHSNNNVIDVVTNKSFLFLLPLTGLSINDSRIKNSYLFYKDYNFDEYFIYILVESMVEDIGIGEKIEDKIYKVQILDKYKPEYDLFLSGEYSKYSLEAKMVICKDVAKGGNIGETVAFSILNKLPHRKKYLEDLIGEKLSNEAELCSIYSEKGELYA